MSMRWLQRARGRWVWQRASRQLRRAQTERRRAFWGELPRQQRQWFHALAWAQMGFPLWVGVSLVAVGALHTLQDALWPLQSALPVHLVVIAMGLLLITGRFRQKLRIELDTALQQEPESARLREHECAAVTDACLNRLVPPAPPARRSRL